MSPAAGRPRRTVLGVALAILAAALLSAFLLFDTHPKGGWEGKLVLVPKGSPLSEVVAILREGGVLPHPLAFRALVLLTFSGRRLHYGEYAFPAPPSAFEAWRRLVRGDVIKYEVTVHPGANLYDVAELLKEKRLATTEAFLAAAASPAVLRRLEIPGESAEGYLFPDSYIFVKPVTPEEILEFMVRQFRRKVPPDAENRAREAGFTLHQVVTIASIIEKETGIEEEKPIVSAVIRRRTGPRHAAPDGPDGDLRGEAIRRDGDGEGPADGGTVQHLPEPGAAPGADLQPGARGARRRPESVDVGVPLLRVAERRVPHVLANAFGA